MVKFGTSGLRGLVTELTDKTCYLYTRAYLDYLLEKNLVQKGAPVAVAGDLRPSTEKILRAVASAIIDSGFVVDYCGTVPTPTVSLYGFTRNIPSIMVTGSHIPFDRNGIKFNLPNGEILKKDEQAITETFNRISNENYVDKFDENDSLINIGELPKTNELAEKEYIERYLNFFGSDLLKGKKIVIYQHSSVIRDILVEIVEKLGAETIALERADDFIPIDTESLEESVLQKAAQWAKEYEPFAIISADGDGDRPVLFDEKGNFIRGDILGILCSEFLKADSLSMPISCNTAVEKCAKFEKVNRTRIGSPFVIEAMYEDQKQGRKRVVSYEANGGYLTADDIELNGRVLRALPTRDSILPILGATALAEEKNLSLSELVKLYPQRVVWTETVKEFPTEISLKILEQISKEKTDAKEIAQKLFDLPVPVENIDYTDGARMTLRNNEILHIRPSGNAPELRIYLEADSLERSRALADIIVQKAAALKEAGINFDQI